MHDATGTPVRWWNSQQLNAGTKHDCLTQLRNLSKPCFLFRMFILLFFNILGNFLDMAFEISDQPAYGTWNIRVEGFVSLTSLLL